MAKKQFYSIEEACEKLGTSQDALKTLVREGTLREFRDAGKVFFKSEDVDRLAARTLPTAADDTGEILLEPVSLDDGSAGGSGDVPALVESSGGTSIIGLEPIDDEPKQGSGAPAGGKKKGDTVISASGIGVFDEDELEVEADPMAKTQITSGPVEDQISLEGAGSGSGLLDLAREADDTALGADLLDEIYPGEDVAPASQKTATPAPVAAVEDAPIEEPTVMEPVAPVVVYTNVGDPHEGMMTGLLFACVLLLAVSGTVIGGLMQGFMPDFGKLLTDGTNFWFFVGGAFLLAGLFLAGGWFLGRSVAVAPRRAK